MKRSEMLDILVYETLSWDGLDTSGVPLTEIANDILTCLEKRGMLPPQQETVYDNYGETVYVSEVCYWDKE